MATGETLLRWEANLCNLSPEPQVYESSGDHVTALLSDRSLQTCQLLFPSSRSSMTSVILVHRLLSSRSPRLNVFGQYIDCSPINGLWMFAMEATGTLQPCISYTGVEVGDFTMCRYRCDTDGLVNYVVLGISDLQTLSTTNSAVICDIALVWGTPTIFEKDWMLISSKKYRPAKTQPNFTKLYTSPLIARFMGPTWGPSGTDRTQVGPMLAPWNLLSGS